MTQTQAEPTGLALAPLLMGVVADMRQASGADIVSLVLYDDGSHRYYAPVAIGQPEESLLDSVNDMDEQMARYLADLEQAKVPDELDVPQYGSTVWLTVTRRVLVARDAQHEIGSTFVRRYGIVSTIGLPLVTGGRLVGLIYLNYRAPEHDEVDGGGRGSRIPDAERLARLERRAARAAHAIQDALTRAEGVALDGLRSLTALLTAPAVADGTGGAAMRRQLSIALSEVLLATDLDAGVVYQLSSPPRRLELVSANAPTAAPLRVELPDDEKEWERAVTTAVAEAMAPARLYPAVTFALGPSADLQGYVAVLSRDRLAPVRKTPAADVLLDAAADLIAGCLANYRLIADLERSNRLMSALSRMTNAMLLPGSSRQQVIDAVARHLTDATVPEFDFHFASVFLVEEGGDKGLVMRMSAGATTTSDVVSVEVREGPAPNGESARIPRWVLQKERALASDDVLSFVANSWRVAVVGALPRPGEPEPDDLVASYPPDQVRRVSVPVVRKDGSVSVTVPACMVTDPDDRQGKAVVMPDPPFTLAAEIFERSGHADLVRVFLPFGLDRRNRATGVLEVGYHRSAARRPDRTQIEALRAAAAQVAVAVDTARLYEEARRHAEQLELSAEVSRAIAASIDIDETLRVVARTMVRLVDVSLCQIALYDEDGSGWYGAAASDREKLWQRQRGERPERSFVFQALDDHRPLVIEDVRSSELVPRTYAETFGVRALLAVPLLAVGKPIGAAVLAQRDHPRRFTAEEVTRVQGFAHQAAVAINNARLHAQTEEERHIQKDVILLGFGQWGQRAYQHLLTLKQFFNFRIHVVERDDPARHDELLARAQQVQASGDAFYLDSPATSAHKQLETELETSCYAITYIATPASTHLPMVARYYDLSDVIVIEKPLGASPDSWRAFLDGAPGGVELVAADHYYFKLEVRLLQLLLTEERTLRDFLDSVDEIRIEILEAKPLTGAAGQIGVVADLLPHAFAIVSLFTPVDRIELDPEAPLLVGRHEPADGTRETYARMQATFPYRGRRVRLVIDVGKGVEDAKWITLYGEHRSTGRSGFYKFDFSKGEAIDGTQSNVRAAIRKIREPGVPDNAQLTMLRHVIEKRHPAVGILSIREAIRSNQRIQDLEAMAGTLLESGRATVYPVGSRPAFAGPQIPQVETDGVVEPVSSIERERARHG